MRYALSLLIVLVGCIDAPPAAPALDDSVRKAPPPAADWARVARLGGLNVRVESSDLELGHALSALVDQHVTVVEADSRLSEHLSDEEFDAELGLMRRVAQLAHERNLKVVWYGTSLEVVSVGGEAGPSMAKEHPDWVQLSWDGAPNVFTGSKVFWVDPGDESAWMSPRSGYREYFFERLARIAGTGIDGFWLDVPLYNDIVGRWASYHPADVARFKADTGLEMPVVTEEHLDPADPVARAWIWWRHQEIDRFLKDAHARVRAANPAFTLVVETVTMDYNAALLEGLDGAMQGPLDGFLHVWEVDVLSDHSGMARAAPNDVYSLIAMYKFGRGADLGRAAWAFSYGDAPDDAELVMAVCVAAGVNPYELKAPEMTTTVGVDFRTRMFGWLEAYEDEVFRAQSRARVALLHSSASRAVVDGCVLSGLCGVALYSSWQNPEPGKPWWTTQEADRVEATHYMAEYRGLAKALTQLHVPYDLLPTRLLTAADAARYDVLIAPSLEAVSDAELAVLRGFVQGGGQLLLTAAAPGRTTETGALRSVGAFDDLLAPADCVDANLGAGALRYCSQDVGARVLRTDDAAALDVVRAFAARSTPALHTDAPPTVYVEAAEQDGNLLFHFVNFGGVGGSFSVAPVTFEVRVPTGGHPVVRAERSSARDGDASLEVRVVGDEAVFQLTVSVHQLVTLELGE